MKILSDYRKYQNSTTYQQLKPSNGSAVSGKPENLGRLGMDFGGNALRNGVPYILASCLADAKMSSQHASGRLAMSLQPVDAALFALVGAEKEAIMGIREMSNRLSHEVTSLRLLLKSHDKSDVVPQDSVAYLQALMDRYGVFARKNAARKVADGKALVRDLSTDEATTHVLALKGVQKKIGDINDAITALRNQQLELARLTANPAAKVRLADLKNQAKLIVNAVGDYLKGMNQSDPEHFADRFNLFSAIIDSANHPVELGNQATRQEDESVEMNAVQGEADAGNAAG